MTIPPGNAFNQAGSNSQIGVQGEYVTIHGDVKVTAAPEESPQAKYRAGVANLNSRNPGPARQLIWDAMMGWEANGNQGVTGEVLFHWLVAMLSGRTVRQFTEAEIGQLRHFRSRCTKNGSDQWWEGVRLIYQLLDSMLRSPQESPPQESPQDKYRPQFGTSLPISRFDGLGTRQRELLRSLDLFLSGPRKEEMWRDELRCARDRQRSLERLTHAWMFFHPDPARVILPGPRHERGIAADQWLMRVSAALFVALVGYLGVEFLAQGSVLGLLGYVAGLSGGIVAAAAHLETCNPPQRHYPPAVHPDDGHAGGLSERIERIFDRQFERCEPIEINRRLWAEAAAAARQFYRDEIIAICLANGYCADQVAWLIRHEVRQMNQRWRDGSPQFPRQRPAPSARAVVARRAGLAMLVLGFSVVLLTARAHLLDLAVVVLSAIWAWRSWLRVSLERVESEEHKRRQDDIDQAYIRWDTRLKDRPKDARMAAWLEDDRTVLLGMALDQFHLSRSGLVAHGFLEKPAPFAKRSQISGGLPRYQRYQIWTFLLAEDGVHQLRAYLDFLTGDLVEQEQISYGYSSIAAVRMLRRSGGVRTYELSLTAGEPITVRVRETDSRPVTQDERDGDSAPAEDNGEDTAPDVASVTNTLRLLQGVVGGGKNWLREHNWTNAWTDSQPN